MQKHAPTNGKYRKRERAIKYIETEREEREKNRSRIEDFRLLYYSRSESK